MDTLFFGAALCLVLWTVRVYRLRQSAQLIVENSIFHVDFAVSVKDAHRHSILSAVYVSGFGVLMDGSEGAWIRNPVIGFNQSQVRLMGVILRRREIELVYGNETHHERLCLLHQLKTAEERQAVARKFEYETGVVVKID